MTDARALHVRAASSPGAGALADTVREVAAELAAIRSSFGSDPTSTVGLSDRLEVAGEELHVLEEEVSAQLAELERAVVVRGEERLLTRRLLATLPVPLIATNTDGAVLEANSAAVGLLGVSARTVERKPLFVYVDAASRRTARGTRQDGSQGSPGSPRSLRRRPAASAGRPAASGWCACTR